MPQMIEAKVEGGELVIRLPWNSQGSPSSTGKSRVYATTKGNSLTLIEGLPKDSQGVPVSMMIGVNVFSKE